jgi:hypothetical protein
MLLLQTNSYVVPRDKRAEHARLLRKFRQTMARLGCDTFEVYEQVGTNWSLNQTSGRFVQIIRFRDRQHQLQVQAAEQSDPIAQEQIAEFCQLVNLPYQQQQGMFAVGYYTALYPAPPTQRVQEVEYAAVEEVTQAPAQEQAVDVQVEPAPEEAPESAEAVEPQNRDGHS